MSIITIIAGPVTSASAPNCPTCGRPTEWNGTQGGTGRTRDVWRCPSGHTHTT